ncbi:MULTISPECIES: AI-2E family transporter [unclassified Coleofasciculus]|uniref:AI-2E family transporter n=1 Tax=unclassified Coleofasciculus TaxID=2692782 RepID=UPI00187F4A93|nr:MULTISPECIES: AI-2E family transporter [unclassified Coleofasciculus]MBE9126343.1 AI-2E family transporter [Coleofasciculus sp. LEGE 07081]MBE9147480.1 AI-2E family transporter [Coleofasciculus sp. LEGE 07092]
MSLGKWIGLLVFIVSLYVLWQIRQILMLVFAAIVIANALNILVERFQRSGLKRVFAVLLSIFLLLAIFVGFYFIIVPPFTKQFLELSELVPKGIEQLSNWLEALEADLPDELLDRYIPDINQLIQQLQPFVNRLLGGGFSFFNNALGVLLNSLLVIILTLMLLADPQSYRKSFIRLFPSFYRRRVDEILDECNKSLRGWLGGVLFNMAVIALLSFVGLLILRIPLALAQATLAGIFTFIPNIGPALSVVPPIAIALLDSPWKAITVLLLYILIQQVESNLLTPYVMAQQVSLLPAVTLLAQVFFATIFGFLGLFLALPLTVVVQVWLKEVLIKDVLDRWNH